MKRLSGWTLCTLVALLTACGSMSTMDRARALAPGQVRAGISGGAIGSAEDRGAAFHPRGELFLGAGVEPGTEIFGKFWYGGFTAGSKLEVARSDSPNSGIDLAVAPAIGYHWADKLTVDFPILTGVLTGDGSQVVLALKPTYAAWLSPGGVPRPVSYVFLGGSLGYFWQLTQNLAVMPEVAWAGNVFAEEGFATSLGDGVGLQFSLGVFVMR
ncbi:MAG: hypothetical protein IPK82_30525 [Polyangiaceae bacterium]|nr:hypothetical protein [Polyangiaceae bacterium]